MKIAIHLRPGSFSERWIKYCENQKIDYKKVNCYDNDIIHKLKDCQGLMWHWSHLDYRDQLFARQLILSLENTGLLVYPNSNTCWHYDDKIAQKYLLESIGAPLVPTYVFYDEESAYEWIEKARFPIVFKLKGGAGSLNVRIVKNKNEAKDLIRKMFGKGLPLYSKSSDLWQRKWILKRDKNFDSLIHFFKGVGRQFYPRKELGLLQIQKGYVYFQDFIPNNQFDDRVVVIGNRALAIRRLVRKNDFRASGSGVLKYNPDLFPKEIFKIAFDITLKLGAQSLAFDFIYDENQKPLITEISYAFVMGSFYDNCPGFWDIDLHWHRDNVDPQRYIFEDFITTIFRRLGYI